MTERELAKVERERLRAIITRNLLECCDYCRSLLKQQLEREERLGAN